jgi:hypothetical protein
MKRKRYSVEQIIGKLREAEVLLSRGRIVKEVSRKLRVTERPLADGERNRGLKVPDERPKHGRL